MTDLAFSYNREYKTFVMVLSTRSLGEPNGIDRVQTGDVTAVRNRGSGIGGSTLATYLYLLVNGLERLEMERLTHSVGEPFREDGEYDPDLRPGSKRLDRHRYCVPFDRLKEYVPRIDVARILDVTDPYQPFMPVNDDNLFITPEPPLNVRGLVWDKVFTRFI